jgi:hypothetical protein
MRRVFLWMLAGAVIGFVAMLLTVEALAGPHAIGELSRSAWLLLIPGGLIPGMVLGTMFGVADAVLAGLRELRNELRARDEKSDGTPDAPKAPDPRFTELRR